MAIPKITVTGKVHHVSESSQITATFQKREFVLMFEDEKDSKFNQYVKFELKQAKTDLLLPIHVGKTVTLECNLNGKEYEKDGKKSYFNSLDVWKVDFAAAHTPLPVAAPSNASDDDDLPF